MTEKQTYENEGKPWSLEEDQFIWEYRNIGLDFIGPHDLGRSPESTKARWVYLKRTFANRAIRRMRAAEISATHAPGRTIAYRRQWRDRYAKAEADYKVRVAVDQSTQTAAE